MKEKSRTAPADVWIRSDFPFWGLALFAWSAKPLAKKRVKKRTNEELAWPFLFLFLMADNRIKWRENMRSISAMNAWKIELETKITLINLLFMRWEQYFSVQGRLCPRPLFKLKDERKAKFDCSFLSLEIIFPLPLSGLTESVLREHQRVRNGLDLRLRLGGIKRTNTWPHFLFSFPQSRLTQHGPLLLVEET